MADTSTEASLNPTAAVTVSDDLLTIDIDSYAASTTYTTLGSEVSVGDETTTLSKLNHKIEGKGTDANPYTYSYENDTDKDANSYPYISKTKNGKETDSKRTMAIGVRDDSGTDLGLTGDTNTDNLNTNNGNEFRYNAGNLANEYSDLDETLTTKKLEDGSIHYYAGDDEISAEKAEDADAYNTSDTLSGSFDHYNTVVKPLSLRN